MPVIFSSPAYAMPPDFADICTAAAPVLADAGWHVHIGGAADTADVAALSAALQQAHSHSQDLLVIGTGSSVIAPDVISDLSAMCGGDRQLDVVIGVADPLESLCHGWSVGADLGESAPLERVAQDTFECPKAWRDFTQRASLAPLLRNPQVRLHAVPLAELSVNLLDFLFQNTLGLDSAVTLGLSEHRTDTATARSDAQRLISVMLQRDGGLMNAAARAVQIANIPECELRELIESIDEDATIARRDLVLKLPEAMQADLNVLATEMAGHWTHATGSPPRLSQGSIRLRTHDIDAVLSVGSIADRAADIAGLSRADTVSQAPQHSQADVKTASPRADVASKVSQTRVRRKADAQRRTSGAKTDTPSGDAGPKLLGLGHSHIGALDLAWKAGVGAASGVTYRSTHLNAQGFQPNFIQGKGRRQVAPEFRNALADLLTSEAPDLIVALPMGNEYNAVAMVPVGPPFEFFSSVEAATPTPGVWQVSYAMMRAQITALAKRNALLVLAAIEEVANCPVLALPPPPPVRDEGHIRAHPGRFAKAVAQSGLNPPDLRARLWQLYADVLADALATTQTVFVTLPDAVFELHDGQRYLAPTMRSDDPTHANAIYGAAIFQAIVEQWPVSQASAA